MQTPFQRLRRPLQRRTDTVSEIALAVLEILDAPSEIALDVQNFPEAVEAPPAVSNFRRRRFRNSPSPFRSILAPPQYITSVAALEHTFRYFRPFASVPQAIGFGTSDDWFRHLGQFVSVSQTICFGTSDAPFRCHCARARAREFVRAFARARARARAGLVPRARGVGTRDNAPLGPGPPMS